MSDETNATHDTEQAARRVSDSGVARLEDAVSTLSNTVVNNVQLPLERLATNFGALIRELAQERADRSSTCPQSEKLIELDRRLTALDTRLKIVQWVGGVIGSVIMAAIVIPGVSWAAKAIGLLLLGN